MQDGSRESLQVLGWNPHRLSLQKGVWGGSSGEAPDTLLLIGHAGTVHTRGWKAMGGKRQEGPFSGALADEAVWGPGRAI